MVFLHDQDIIHGDLKAANVLVSNEFHALLCDFGLAKTVTNETSVGLEGAGSIRWQSVEIIEQGGGKTFKSDVWAFGMLIYEVGRWLTVDGI